MIDGYRDKRDEVVATTVPGAGRHVTEVSGDAAGAADTRRPGASRRHAINRAPSACGWFIATLSSVSSVVNQAGPVCQTLA